MAKHKIEITNSLLTRLAGKGAFSRGKDLYESDAVLSCSVKGNTIKAEVQGTYPYIVTLQHTSSLLDGYCTCPASEEMDFCKHCVAVALHYKQQTDVKHSIKGASAVGRIDTYLGTLSKKELQNSLLELIDNDSQLKRVWELRAMQAMGLMDAKTLKKRITAALPYKRNCYRYAQVRAYFAAAEPEIEALGSELPNIEPKQALALVDYALQRLCKVLETIDDSGGFRFEVESLLKEFHVETVARQGWSEAKLANYLVELMDVDSTDAYPEIPGDYFDVLGEEGLHAFFDILQQHWDKLPPLAVGADWDDKWPYFKLQRHLEWWAEERDDIDGLIKLKEKTAISTRDFIELSKLSESLGDLDAAQRWLDKGKKIEGATDQAINRAQIELWIKCGQREKAVDLQWQLYSETLSLADYKHILVLAGKKADKKYWYDKSKALLRYCVDKAKKPFARSRFVYSLAEFYLHEGEVELALELHESYGLDDNLVFEIAKKLKKQPQLAVRLFVSLADHYVNRANNDAYRKAIDMLLEASRIIKNKALRQMLDQELLRMRKQYKAKRNFMALLDEFE